MDYLTIIGGVFLAWFVLVLLFAPHIPYHIEREIDAASDYFVHMLEATCQTRLEDGNRIEIFTGGSAFYPAMLEAIRNGVEASEVLVAHGRFHDECRDVEATLLVLARSAG